MCVDLDGLVAEITNVLKRLLQIFKMNSTWKNDTRKLTKILHEKNDSDDESASINSNDLVVDCEMFEKMGNTSNDIIKNCQNYDLRYALIVNIEKRSALYQIIEKLEDNLIKLKHKYREFRTNMFKNSKEAKREKNNLKKKVGVPYFKDFTSYASPANSDYVKIRNSKVFLQNTKINWTTEDKCSLSNGVYLQICNKKIEELNKDLDKHHANKDEEMIKLLEHDINIFRNSNLISLLVAKWKMLHTELKNESKETQDDAELIIKTICDWDQKIDWLEISAKYLDCRHTDIQCKAMWHCHVSPKFSKDKWSVNENKKLTELCEKHNYENWDDIAMELGSQRSAFQCCVHFHAKLCEKFNRDKWTPEEDMYLHSVVQMCSVGNYISWGKVAYYFKHRTKKQIYRHYNQCIQLNVKKGNFSIEEDILLLTLMQLYNNDIFQINKYFPNRLSFQLRERMRTLSTDTTRAWTSHEDSKIIAFVDKHGQKNWIELTKEINRSSGCIRHRYRTIKKFFELNPNSSVHDIPRRGPGRYRIAIRKRQNLISKVVRFLMYKAERTVTKPSVLNLEYVQEILKPFAETETKIEKKKPDPPININYIIHEFFQCSYKRVLRVPMKSTPDYINGSAERIDSLLQMLGANLVFPSLETIENHPILDDVDKLIIKQLILKKDEPKNYRQNLQAQNLKMIPPSIESLIGFRGVLLHMHTLKKHGRTKYEGYNLYVKSGPNLEYLLHNYTYNKMLIEDMPFKYEEPIKQIALQNREIFSRRLKLIFKWPFVIADTKIIPCKEIEIIEPKERQICGRKPRHVKHYKIMRMNEARKKLALLESNSLKIIEVEEDSPAKKIKLDN